MSCRWCEDEEESGEGQVMVEKKELFWSGTPQIKALFGSACIKQTYM
jgi:hypothetical protein